jgi:hypothetical protein
MGRVFGVLAILVFIGLACFAGVVAQRKGRSFGVYTIAGLIVGPIALLIAAVVPTAAIVAPMSRRFRKLRDAGVAAASSCRRWATARAG